MIGLAAVLSTEGNWELAIKVLDRAVEKNPDDPSLAFRRALTIPKILESSEQIERSREMTNRRLDELLEQEVEPSQNAAKFNFTAFELPCQGRTDRGIQEKIARVASKLFPSLSYSAPHVSQPRTTGKIRVGFLSEFFYSHTISKLNVGLLEQLNADQFEKHLFLFPKKEDDWRTRAQSAADAVVELPRNLEAARTKIADSELDVLFYPDIGMGTQSYRLAFSRLARVQAVSWGHPITTGIPAVDYFVSADKIETPEADQHYSEKLIRMERLPCYYYRKEVADTPYPWRKHGFDKLHHIYLCPQSQFKVHPDFDVILGGILARDINAVIVFIEGLSEWSQKLRRRLQESIGIELADRVQFIPAVDQDEFVQMVRDAHVVLDPVAFGGGNTSYEAMLVGTPVVTCPGELMRNRVTAGLYEQMGITDCVVKNSTEYVTRAVEIAKDSRLRGRLRDKIIKGGDAIFEDDLAVREFESFIKTALNEVDDS
jgi:protein O-GlcNAc transferase